MLKARARKVFRFLSLISLSLVFVVILMGAYLSALGQGLSCPEWPLCPMGLGFPPVNEYAMEYIHRLTAAVTAVSVYITAIYSSTRFVYARKPAIINSAAVSLQIVIGMFVVLLRLEPVVVAIHTGIGVFTLAMAFLTFILSFPDISAHIVSSKTPVMDEGQQD